MITSRNSAADDTATGHVAKRDQQILKSRNAAMTRVCSLSSAAAAPPTRSHFVTLSRNGRRRSHATPRATPSINTATIAPANTAGQSRAIRTAGTSPMKIRTIGSPRYLSFDSRLAARNTANPFCLASNSKPARWRLPVLSSSAAAAAASSTHSSAVGDVVPHRGQKQAPKPHSHPQ